MKGFKMNITVQNIFAAIDSATKSGTKATELFRSFVGFPTAAPDAMESQYALVLAGCTVDKDMSATAKAVAMNRNTAVRMLMSRCRASCATPYSKNKKGAITIKPVGVKTKGANAKGEAKDKPMGDAAVLKRFGEMATAFLTAEDKLIASRLIAAISNKIKLATTSKK